MIASNLNNIFLFAGAESLRDFFVRGDDTGLNNTIYTYSQNIDLKEDRQNDNTGAGKVIDLLEVSNMNKLNSMADFQDDWDGQGGQAFSSEAILFFKKILKNLDKQPEIAPTGRNSLYMQYSEDKSILAFELSLNSAEMVYVPSGDYSSAETHVFTEDMDQHINECVRNLYGTGVH